MEKLSEKDTQPKTLPSSILDDVEALTINETMRAKSSNYNPTDYHLLDEGPKYVSEIAEEWQNNPDISFSRSCVYSLPMRRTASIFCPIHGNDNERKSDLDPTQSHENVVDSHEKHIIKKELANIFKEICIITDKIRNEVDNSIQIHNQDFIIK